jgi:hypothetical protein
VRRREPEHAEQKQLFRWAVLHEDRVPELQGLFAVPNGGKRHVIVAKKLKAEGVKAGVLDVWLPVSRAGYHGLVMEMKRPGAITRLSEEQKWWHRFLTMQGWLTSTHDNWQSAWNVLIRYLNRPDLAQLEPGV